MAAVELATGYVSLIPSAKGIAAGIEKELGAPTAAAAKSSGAKAGDTFAKTFKAGLAVVGVGVGLAAGLGAIGQKFEGAFATIARGTGATGKTLDGLKASFDTVLKAGSGSMEQVSAAVTTLYQRTGLTGKALEGFATKQVALARITKTDVNTNLQATTGLFNLYGIAVDQQSAKLDVLFRASQIAGVTVSQLAADMQTAAPTAKILGLNIDQTASIVAGLEKAGLPASRVMQGLASTFAKAAKAGKDPVSVIRDLVAQVKAAPNATDAATIAVQKFGIGARQAAVLVGGIRSGAIDLTKSLSGGKGILETAKSTATLSGAFAHLKNVALVGLQPLATKVLNAFTKGIQALAPFVGDLFSWFGSELPKVFAAVQPFFTQAANGIRAFAAALQGEGVTSTGFVGTMERIGVAVRALAQRVVPIGQAIAKAVQSAFGWLLDHKDVLAAIFVGLGATVVVFFTAWAASAAAAAAATIAAAAPLLLLAAGAALVAGGLFLAFKRVQVFHDAVVAVGRFIASINWGQIFHAVADAIRTAIAVATKVVAAFVGFFTSHASDFRRIGDQIVKVFRQIVPTVRAAFTAIAAVIKVALAIVVGITIGVVRTVQTLWDRFGHQLLDHLRIAFNAVVQVIRGALQIVQGIFEIVTGILTLHWSKAWQGIKDVFAGVWNALAGIVKGAINAISTAIGAGMAAISAVWALAWHTFQSVVDGVFSGVLNFIKQKWPLIIAIITGPVGIVTLLIVRNFDKIKHAFFALVDFVGTQASRLVNFIKAIPGKIASIAAHMFDAIKNAATVIFTDVSRAFDRIVNFIRGLPGKIGRAAAGMFDGIKNAFRAAINFIIRAWNGLQFRIPGVHVGHVEFGGFTLGTPDIAQLAHGDVATQPTLAMIGETPASRPEIVSPVKLLADTFRSELKRSGTGQVNAPLIVQGNVYGVDDLDKWADRRDRNLELALAAKAGRG